MWLTFLFRHCSVWVLGARSQSPNHVVVYSGGPNVLEMGNFKAVIGDPVRKHLKLGVRLSMF